MRHFVALTAAVSCIVLTWCACALALDPSLDISQYAHSAWKVRDGFAKGEIPAIAQTPDGYLWLGTRFGLLRFDGVRNVPWHPPGNQRLPSSEIFSLLATRDGTLWIGTFKGLATWKDGKLTQYPDLAESYIFKILQDHEGTVWVGSALSRVGGKLCAIRKSGLQCYGEGGSLGRGVIGLYEDRKGNLWVGVETGLWRWTPGPPKFYALAGEPDGIRALSEDTDGTLLVGLKAGIYRFVDGKTEALSLPHVVGQPRIYGMVRDRDGGLWIGTVSHGLIHLHNGRTDVFGPADGLSGDHVLSLFEDHEGTIWAATLNGLDRFRDFAVATLTTNQGLSSSVAVSTLADKDGSVWINTLGGLDRWNDGQIKTYGPGSDKRTRKRDDAATSLFQDDHGRVWVATFGGIGYLEKGKFIPISSVPGGNVLSIVQGRRGYIWVANETLGLFRLSPRGEVLQIPWAALGHKDHASILAPDSQAGIWIGFFLGGIAYISPNGQIRASYTATDGLGEGRISSLQFDHDGTLWTSTEEGGLSRLKNGRMATLNSKNGLPCDTVNWVVEDNDRSFWLYTACGLVRISRSELDAWAASVDQNTDAKRTIQVTVFDSFDGVRSLPRSGHYSPQVAETPDGRIWFLPEDGVSIVDPRHLHSNKLPPPVHIEQITADHKTYQATPDSDGSVRLPPLIRDIQIDYTALSLVAPEKVLFRYKLEGWDRDWQDAGTRRQALYSNLPPRTYTFRVMACNNSGVWNETGSSLEFSVLPAFYQTTWFRIVCVFGFVALLWGIYQLRVQHMQRQFNIALDARVNERTRIARELHDTLLQNFHGLMFQFQAASNLMLRRPDEAKQSLDDAIIETKKALHESREAIQDLRSEPIATGNLAEFLMSMSPELTGSDTNEPPPVFDLIEEGERQTLSSTVSKEICRIALELLRNAYQHSHAQRIEAEIRYGESMFRLRIRDDGKGIEPKVLKEGGRLGHWGLRGVRERADRIGARLDLWSEPGQGTEVQLLLPTSVAYQNSNDSFRAKLVRKLKSNASRS